MKKNNEWKWLNYYRFKWIKYEMKKRIFIKTDGYWFTVKILALSNRNFIPTVINSLWRIQSSFTIIISHIIIFIQNFETRIKALFINGEVMGNGEPGSRRLENKRWNDVALGALFHLNRAKWCQVSREWWPVCLYFHSELRILYYTQSRFAIRICIWIVNSSTILIRQ